MIVKGKDLVRDFPEIGVFVDSIVRRSTGNVVGICFVRKPSTPSGNFFRIRGRLTEKQISQLARAHKLPTTGAQGLTKIQKGPWTEYSTPIGLNQVNVVNIVFAEDYCQTVSSFLMRVLDCEYDPVRVFVNGKDIGPSVDWERLGRGDVVVAMSDGDAHSQGSLLSFESMPTLEVFQVNLRGPYRHDLMRGISPGQAWMNEELYKVWKLRGTDEIICPHCGKGDCLNHRLSGDEEIFVHRCHENRSKHLYAFQSTALIGQDATEVLIPFAPAVLGRKVSNDVWPSGVLKLTIGDTDATRSTCASSIEARDTVSVYLANPKL